MKNLILFLLLIPFSLYAQVQVEDRKAAMNGEAEDCLVKISSDSEMRIQMMDMMVEKTRGNLEEMNKLAASISNNPELLQIIVDSNPERAGSDDFSVELPGFNEVNEDNIKVGTMVGTQPVPKSKK